MRTEKPNNPSAFPLAIDSCVDKYKGMTLRDYFAAKAMQAMVSSEFESRFEPIKWPEYAYQIADAMLKQREL